MKPSTYFGYVASLSTLAGQAQAAINLDLNSDASIKRAAATAAFDLMKYYTGNRTGDVPGNLPAPYYWWQCGAMFGTVMNYAYLTGDTSYNEAVMQGMVHQAGPDAVFEPVNQTKSLGNDDQAFWGLAAMTAAETKFPDPPAGTPGWLALAQGVFNRQIARWDEQFCKGGLRWQIHSFNGPGFNYKNSISNGCLFQLAARLALYTGNQTYADWAEKTYTWSKEIGLISDDFSVFDGGNIKDECVSKDPNQWTYNNGIYTLGSAAMYNLTNGSTVWKARIDGLMTASKKFFVDDVMYEPCEQSGKCNNDQKSFKAYFTRWLAATTQLAPYTHDNIMREIRTSAAAAAKACSGGASGTQCGIRWTVEGHDGSPGGVGEQMSALEVFQSNLIDKAPTWASDVKGTGTSQGDVNAGSGARTVDEKLSKPITTGDRAGAGFLTALIILGVIGGTATMMISE